MKKEKITDYDRAVGIKLREIRKKKGFTIRKMASLIGCHENQLSYYERGTTRISAGTLKKVSEILGVPVESFFD